MGLVGYVVYKLKRLDQKLDELESKLERISAEMNLIDEFNDQLLDYCQKNDNENDNNEDGDDKKEDEDYLLNGYLNQRIGSNSVKVEHLSRNMERSRNSLSSQDQIKLAKMRPATKKKCVSFESDLDNLSYETPSTSPERQSLNDEQEVVDDSIDNAFIERYNFVETLSNLERIVVEKRSEYEQEPGNINRAISYLRTIYCMGERKCHGEEKKKLALEAYELATKCLQLNEHMYLSHKWLSLSAGRLTEYVGLNEKVKLGFEFKNHLDLAIEINSSDYLLFYLRGRWYFKMCNLSWIEKNCVRLLFSNVPEITFEDALNDFERVEVLHRNKSKGNLLHLAKCLIVKNEVERAKELLKVALSLPKRTAEHEENNKEIESIMKKYS